MNVLQMQAPAVTFTAAYCKILMDLLSHGEMVSPRGQATLEIPGYGFTILNSRENLLASPTRKLSQSYAIAEWLWIMYGRNDVATIAQYNKNIAQFSDDGRRFFGAYGPMVVEQWSYAKSRLKEDNESRQAVIQIWRPRPGQTKDTPCTLSLQFLVRNEQLHMIVTMRSNDAWLGTPYDVFTFTQLQQKMAAELGINPGWYHHNVGSMHLYEQHWPLAEQVVHELRWQLEHDRLPPENYRWSDNPPAILEALFVALGAGTTERQKYQVMCALTESCALSPEHVAWEAYASILWNKLMPHEKMPVPPGTVYGKLYELIRTTAYETKP